MGSLKCVCCFTICIRRPSASLPCYRRAGGFRSPACSSSTRSLPKAIEIADEGLLEVFLREREQNGDFVSRMCDKIWHRSRRSSDDEFILLRETNGSQEQVADDDDNGYLKMSRMQNWVAGDVQAPSNTKQSSRDLLNDSEFRKKLNALKYEALKKELSLLSAAIGTACTGYCFAVFSVQAAASYAVGVSFSFLYLQLLCRHVESLSKEKVPQIFMQRRPKKIGIRSEDLRDGVEKWVKGSGIALSSPRLMIPAAIFAVWAVSRNIGLDKYFSFELVPAMMGMFVYKAAALVQVYRDNEDLQILFPEEEDDRSKRN